MADDSCEDKQTQGSSGEDEVDGEINDEKESKKWDISLEPSTLKRELRALDYFTTNGLRQAFDVLDAKKNGYVAKTQLQIICINLCTVIIVPFSAEDLTGFEKEKADISFDDFYKYISSKLLPKITVDHIDLVKLDEISWTIVEKQRKNSLTKTLSDSELFKLWQAFNKINIDSTVLIDIEEAALLLHDFMNAIGTPWTQGPLDIVSEGKLKLTFWELIDCLESKYIQKTSKSAYLEGVNVISDKYVREIVKKGFLTKKGHKVKSFKERWFVLTPRLMSYYEGKSSAGKKKGVIVINEDSTVEEVEDSKSSKCRFLVVCGGTKKVQYYMEAQDHKTKNQWIAAVQRCIDCSKYSITPLMKELRARAIQRRERREKQAEEEHVRLEQEAVISKQLEELELIRIARDEAKAQAENEAALREEEKKMREELELLKQEYERLLDEEKQARKYENMIREQQQEILENEMTKRRELEKIKTEQDRILEEEKKAREGLEELSKEQQRALDEERERLKALDKERQIAEQELNEARLKLEASETERQAAAQRVEEAKERARKMKVPVGLARPLTVEQKRLITHRGAGAFVEQDFSKTPLYLAQEERPEAVNKRQVLPENERSVIEEPHVVKPSVQKDTFEGGDD